MSMPCFVFSFVDFVVYNALFCFSNFFGVWDIKLACDDPFANSRSVSRIYITRKQIKNLCKELFVSYFCSFYDPI